MGLTYDTLVRCRKFYQAYANASIVATPLPQLENQSEAPDSEEVTNSGVCFAIFAIFTGQNTPSTQAQGTITFVAGALTC